MNDIPKPWQIANLKQRYPPGTRVRVFEMDDPYTEIPPGTEGTVEHVDDIGTIHCTFDNGVSLGLISGVDAFHSIEDESKTQRMRKRSHSHER